MTTEQIRTWTGDFAADYPRLFLDRQSRALKVTRTQIFDCLDEPGNQDICYLLSKVSAKGAV